MAWSCFPKAEKSSPTRAEFNELIDAALERAMANVPQKRLIAQTSVWRSPLIALQAAISAHVPQFYQLDLSTGQAKQYLTYDGNPAAYANIFRVALGSDRTGWRPIPAKGDILRSDYMDVFRVLDALRYHRLSVYSSDPVGRQKQTWSTEPDRPSGYLPSISEVQSQMNSSSRWELGGSDALLNSRLLAWRGTTQLWYLGGQNNNYIPISPYAPTGIIKVVTVDLTFMALGYTGATLVDPGPLPRDVDVEIAVSSASYPTNYSDALSWGTVISTIHIPAGTIRGTSNPINYQAVLIPESASGNNMMIRCKQGLTYDSASLATYLPSPPYVNAYRGSMEAVTVSGSGTAISGYIYYQPYEYVHVTEEI